MVNAGITPAGSTLRLNGPVPPKIATENDPLLPPKQVTSTGVTEAVIGF